MDDNEEVPMDLENNAACWYLVNKYRAYALSTPAPTSTTPSAAAVPAPQFGTFSSAQAAHDAPDDEEEEDEGEGEEEEEEDDPFQRLEEDSIYDDDDDIAEGIFIDNESEDDGPEL